MKRRARAGNDLVGPRTCARDTGNYLINIGPKPDGSIPEESVRIMSTVGKWMERNGKAIYKVDLNGNLFLDAVSKA